MCVQYTGAPMYTVQVPNSNSISCSNSSLLEVPPAMLANLITFPGETCFSQGALVEDGDDLGQFSS